jgi:hypothetical protein
MITSFGYITKFNQKKTLPMGNQGFSFNLNLDFHFYFHFLYKISAIAQVAIPPIRRFNKIWLFQNLKDPPFFGSLFQPKDRNLAMHAKRGIKKCIKKEGRIIPTNKRILRQQIWICVTNLHKKICTKKKKNWPVVGLWEDVF